MTATLGVAGCHGDGTGPGGGNGFSGPNPILFVTQVPVYEFGRATSLFGNHVPTIRSAPRGGDLYIIYPDGKLRNLTKEAGFGVEGLQGPTGIAVREPSVHWDGKKALFSMIVGGAKKQFEETPSLWQIYEVTGLQEGEDAVITRVAGQPEDYNNISPLYGTDDAVLFTSDRPRDGRKALHPQLDEYESAPIVTGLWRLDPATGDLAILNHTASGLFSPIIDSAGRIVFTRWDHLQRDQQEAAERYMGAKYGTFTFVDESDAGDVRASNDEVFPEPLYDDDPQLAANQAPHKFNQFFPWMLNEDGSGEETLNHVGRHEFGGTYGDGVFKDDPNLTYLTPEDYHQNRYYVDDSGGMFHFKEDPVNPGTFYCTEAREFGTDSAGGILKITGGPSLTAEQMTVTPVTDPIARQVTDDESGSDPDHPGHFRNPVPLADGTLIAAHTTESRPDKNEGDDLNPSYRYAFRLKHVVQKGDYWVAGDFLTPGIRKDVTYLDPDNLVTATGNLWELDPVEVRERERPARRVEELPAPEKSVLDQKSVDEQDLRKWLSDRGLALIVTRNVTTRDRADQQQPFNLRVPGGVETIGKPGKVYDVSWLQLLQADLLRGYKNLGPGRRVLAQPMHDPAAQNPPIDAPKGSVSIAKDGSMAALVPARRAMTWQLTDASGAPVVRERNWVSFAPGEIRACPSCHGVNSKDQAGHAEPENPPQALADFIDYWRTLGK